MNIHEVIRSSGQLGMYRVSQKLRPSLMRYILRYENSIVMKEVCLDRVTLHTFCDTKFDPIDDIFTYLSELKWISEKYYKRILEGSILVLLGVSKFWVTS